MRNYDRVYKDEWKIKDITDYLNIGNHNDN